MKFRFRVHRYQTDAAKGVVRISAGQPYSTIMNCVGEIKALRRFEAQ